jgi:hypothetical protein
MASEENATRPAHEEATEMLDLADRMFFDLPPEERLEAVGEYIASVAQVYQRWNAEMPDWLKLLIGRGTR